MSNAPFDISLVTARLRTIAQLQEVGELAEYLAIKELRQFRTPSAYAVMAKETGDINPSGNPAGKQRQVVSVLFGVVIAVRNYRRDASGKLQELDEVLDKVRTAILGWAPDLPMARPCQFVSGEILDSSETVILWGEVYATQHSIGSKS